MKKKTRRITISIIMVLIAYLILDYVNVPSLIGLKPNNINIDMFGILINTALFRKMLRLQWHMCRCRNRFRPLTIPARR